LKIKHTNKFYVPTQLQITVYNAAEEIRGAMESDYLTGPRRGQQLAHDRQIK